MARKLEIPMIQPVRAAATLLVAVGAAFMVGCSKEEPAALAGRTVIQSADDCDKLPDPKSTDDSAAARSAAVTQGMVARSECRREVAARDKGSVRDKANADLARIREIKESEFADSQERKRAAAQRARDVAAAAATPLRKD